LRFWTPGPFSEDVSVAMIEYSAVRGGQILVEEGQLFYVVERELRTPGNLPSKLTLKLKNLKTGFVNTVRVHPSDKVEIAYLDHRQMQYLYQEADGYVFMDNETYDQVTLNKEFVGALMGYMKENTNADVTLYEGKPISIELPATVELKVIDTEPSVKGATAAAQYKPATLETGIKVTVPPFVNIGEIIQVDTRTGEYLSRAK
jgi:elongation factor P